MFEDQEQVTGFRCIGHAGYAEAGSDIICAGVSTLVINTINSIEILTDSLFSVETEEESGLIDFQFQGVVDEGAELLIRSMILGLQGIQQDYGNEYIILNFKEV
ncbi:MAG: ribosomal-processing cysteine protease Prp [Agathobacter sp.]|nr:ribosomal-processing cysteine protease Prp [Agathobacter sp.]